MVEKRQEFMECLRVHNRYVIKIDFEIFFMINNILKE